jgi:hypothetical protein
MAGVTAAGFSVVAVPERRRTGREHERRGYEVKVSMSGNSDMNETLPCQPRESPGLAKVRWVTSDHHDERRKPERGCEEGRR